MGETNEAALQPNASEALALSQALLAWYRAQRRDLPWRRTSDPYRIWVAEIMLQQTQVATVIPYYERFLARFPDVQALAKAELDEVLALWQGLGYYGRARNLHAAARLVCERHGGIIPSNPHEFRSLPGVGPYTAGAVLSIAFGQDEVALDGNVARVLCRLFNDDQDPRTAKGRKELRRYAQALLPPGQAGELNQALMELGATICLPHAPRCPACPLGVSCRARSLGVQEERPVAKRRGELPRREWVAALVEDEGKILAVRRRPQGLLGGLWELPGGEVLPDEEHPQALARILRVHLGLEAAVGEQLATVRHAYSHFQVKVHLYRCAVRGTPTPSGPWDGFHWLASEDYNAYGLTGVTLKALARLGFAVPGSPAGS